MQPKITRASVSDLLKLADSSHTMTISTINSERPQATTVEFCVWDNKIVFDTFKKSRKANNLAKNNSVALTIMPNTDMSIDIEGEAQALTGAERTDAICAYLQKIPEATKWVNHDDITHYAVTVRWIRSTNVGVQPWEIKEAL